MKMKMCLAAGLICGASAAEPIRVVLSFDDSLKDHALIAAPLLEERGWRGVFNIVTDWVGKSDRFMTWAEVRGLAERGHEIATHTKTHTNLVELAAAGRSDLVLKELDESSEAIRSCIGRRPVYMCPPFVAQNGDTARLCREAGLVQMSPRRCNFGAGNEDGVRALVERLAAEGVKRIDILHHGVSAADHGGWCPFRNRETFTRHLDAIAALEREGKIIVTDYDGMSSDRPLDRQAWPRHRRGVLLLTFDDRNYDRWVENLPLFAKYGAHASFFPNGALDDHALGQLAKLKAAGHTVGIHTLHHGDAKSAFQSGKGAEYYENSVKPQLDMYSKIGHTVRSMAYPNNRRCEESDRYLGAKAGIRRFRAGHVVRYDPGKKYPKADLLHTDEVFFPAAELADRAVLEGIGIGEAYRTDIDELVKCVRRAAERDEVLVTFSHDIRPDAGSINMKTPWLERLLATARELDMDVLGFDELPVGGDCGEGV